MLICIDLLMVLVLGLIEYTIECVTGHSATFRGNRMYTMTREEAIAELHEAGTDNIQQVSGRIITYDQILQFAGWERIGKARWLQVVFTQQQPTNVR